MNDLDFTDIYSTNRIGLHENEDVKTYFLVYVDLGMIYLKYNNNTFYYIA